MISTATRRQPSAFSIWLRTGSWPAQPVESAELKFNPYHDPTNGRFTFAPGGGSFGGGGATGGGEATGSWGASRQTKPSKSADVARPKAAATRAAIVATGISGNSTAPTIFKNGYAFRFDGQQRTVEVAGQITLNAAQTRSRSAQATAGGTDRLPTDDGGHYIAEGSTAQPTPSITSLRMPASIEAGIARWRTSGQGDSKRTKGLGDDHANLFRKVTTPGITTGLIYDRRSH